MKKIIISFLGLVVLSGCSSQKEEHTTINQSEVNSSIVETVQSSEETVETGSIDSSNSSSASEKDIEDVDMGSDDSYNEVKTFKQDLDSAKNEIWYMITKDVAKDTTVWEYFVINDQKISIYQLDHNSDLKTLGELSKMEDKDILSYIKEERSKVDIDDYREHANLLFSTDPVPYQLAIKTDATGNRTDAEQISADFKKDSTGDGLLFEYNFTSDSVLYLIYNQEYLGFEIGYDWKNPMVNASSKERMIRKRRTEVDRLILDEPTTEGIVVDGVE